jgi:hypothetical protein
MTDLSFLIRVELHQEPGAVAEPQFHIYDFLNYRSCVAEGRSGRLLGASLRYRL